MSLTIFLLSGCSILGDMVVFSWLSLRTSLLSPSSLLFLYSLPSIEHIHKPSIAFSSYSLLLSFPLLCRCGHLFVVASLTVLNRVIFFASPCPLLCQLHELSCDVFLFFLLSLISIPIDVHACNYAGHCQSSMVYCKNNISIGSHRACWFLGSS